MSYAAFVSHGLEIRINEIPGLECRSAGDASRLTALVARVRPDKSVNTSDG